MFPKWFVCICWTECKMNKHIHMLTVKILTFICVYMSLLHMHTIYKQLCICMFSDDVHSEILYG
jgi:hypothetical protein